MIARLLTDWHHIDHRRGEIIGGLFETNAEAWRWIDRQEGQPLSKSEDRGDWVFGQIAGGKGL